MKYYFRSLMTEGNRFQEEDEERILHLVPGGLLQCFQMAIDMGVSSTSFEYFNDELKCKFEVLITDEDEEEMSDEKIAYMRLLKGSTL